MSRVIIAFALAFLASPAAALQIQYAGTIDQVFDSAGLIDPAYGLGAGFSGSMVLDPSLAVLGSTAPSVYTFPTGDPSAPSGFTGTFEFGGDTLSPRPIHAGDPASIFIFASALIDTSALVPVGLYDIYGIPLSGSPGLTASAPAGSISVCVVALIDSTETAATGSFFVPNDLIGFDTTVFTCDVLQDGTILATVSGHLSQWATVPEPASSVLCLTGALFAGRRGSLQRS